METQMYVGQIDEGCVLRLVGRGTMQESVAFRSAIESNLDCLIVFDASECTYLDSTFLGCLIGIQKCAEKSSQGRFVIAASESMRMQLFTTSSLDKYFDFIDTCPALIGPMEKVPVDHLDAVALGRHIAHCHQRLADRGGPEASAFRSIADRLSRELEGR